MSEQYPGGFITRTEPTVNGSVARGMWTLSQAAGYRKQGLWPTSPGAPTIGTATAGTNADASVAFSAPANIGSTAITNYTVTSSPGGLTGTGASSPITVSGLTVGTSYTFTVTATNGAGTGPASAASNSITAAQANYIEDVMSTWLYTGNGGAQTITNGIDLAGRGGMTWLKMRSPGSGFSSTQDHALFQTAAPDGSDEYLVPNSNSESFYRPTNGIDFTNSGFTVDAASFFGGSGDQSTSNFASWSFRKQAKFFDVVYFVGTGSARTVPHSLGSVPGCVIVKSNSVGNSASYDWAVYHQSLGNTRNLRLNTTAAQETNAAVWNNTSPTASEFTVGTSTRTNQSGVGYVALVFAHNAGGFGLTGTDNVISCGSFTVSSGAATVDLGYEPQWVMYKRTDAIGQWEMVDTMRGFVVTPSTTTKFLLANTTGAEGNWGAVYQPTATGFNINSLPASGSYIYIAIRRGPMRVPTTGTSVFLPATRSGNSGTNTVSGPDSKPVDTVLMTQISTAAVYPLFWDRLRGRGELTTNATSTELFPASSSDGAFWDVQQGMRFVGSSMNVDSFPNTASFNASGVDHIDYRFCRAPGFFDEVCYTGTGVARTVAHNLTVAPELMIVKDRSNTRSWCVYDAFNGATQFTALNTTAGAATSSNAWNNTAPTSSVFTVGIGNETNFSGANFVAYLFASCPGVSKVGSYTGTGTTQLINCGFTSGARFVLIKATSTTGAWYVWDSARGIVAGNDPYLRLNSAAAQVTNTDWVDTAATGFELSNAGGNLANSNGVSYIFLAIA